MKTLPRALAWSLLLAMIATLFAACGKKPDVPMPPKIDDGVPRTQPQPIPLHEVPPNALAHTPSPGTKAAPPAAKPAAPEPAKPQAQPPTDKAAPAKSHNNKRRAGKARNKAHARAAALGNAGGLQNL